jgi:hypothetical protein
VRGGKTSFPTLLYNMELNYAQGNFYHFIGINFILCEQNDYITGTEGLQIVFNTKREMVARVIGS